MPALANNAELSSSAGAQMLNKLKANGISDGAGQNGVNGGVQQQNGHKPVVESFVHKFLGAPYEPPLSPDDPEWPLHVPATTVNDKDKGTADAWYVRHACAFLCVHVLLPSLIVCARALAVVQACVRVVRAVCGLCLRPSGSVQVVSCDDTQM